MKHIKLIPALLLLMLAACSGSEYSEEDKETLEKAETIHYEALNLYNDGFDKISMVTAIQDSIDNRTASVNRMMQVENINTDSLQQVYETLTTANENLTKAKNELLMWPDSIYGLMNVESIYKDPDDSSPGIAKDEENDMITNNITMIDPPADMSPDELLKIQEKQHEDIKKIHQNLEDALSKADKAIVENL